MRIRTRRLARLGLAALLVSLMTGPAESAQAASPPGTSCPVFPSNNVWNTDISSLPVNAHSAAWLASTGAASGRLLHPDFGAPPYGIPFNVVSSSHATANFNFLYWQESDPTVASQQPQGPYPNGSDLLVEGPTDSHLLTIVSDTCKLYETSGTDYNGPHTGWSGSIFDLNSNALRPDTWTSADAAGLPIFPGLVRLDEVQAGAINHAIRFTVQQSDKSHLWPARHDAGTASDPNLPPMGARFRLKSSFDISGFNGPAQVVLTAMKHFGLIVADNGSNWYFQGTMDAGWNNEPYATMVSQLKTVPASAFDAVDESSLMIDPNSGQAAQPTQCATAGVTVALPSPQQQAAQVVFTATSSRCANPQYEFWLQYPSGSWVMKKAFSPSASWTWDTTSYPTGSYILHVWANQQGDGTATYQALAELRYNLTSGACATASLSPVNASAPAGSTVALTASSAGCPKPGYEFWVGYPDGSWHMMQGFSPSTSFSWNTAGLAPGSYGVHVWANNAGDSAATWDANGFTPVTLTGCTSAALSPSSVTQLAGSTVSLTASSSGCPNPLYEFWVGYPDGSWHMMQGFSANNTFNWNTAGMPMGAYSVHVWANQQGASTATWEGNGAASVTLTSGACTAASLSPVNPSSPAGSTVALTASSSGCVNPRYEFWAGYPDGSWHMMQGFSPSNSFSWSTAGLAPGTYSVHVWANNAGDSTATWEANGADSVTLTGCTSATLSPTSGSAALGTKVSFTAGSSGCPNAQYEFWLEYPDGSWHMMSGFTTGNTWQWDTTGFAKGTYTIHAWANQQGAYAGAFEVFGSATYTLT